MMRAFRRSLPFLLAALLAAAGVRGAEENPGFERCKDEMGKLFPIAIDGTRLSLDRNGWNKTPDDLEADKNANPNPDPAWPLCRYRFDRLLRALNRNRIVRNGETRMLKDFFSWTLGGGTADGDCKINTTTGMLELRVTERTGQMRSVKWKEEKTEGVVLELVRNAEDRAVRYLQDPKGAATLVVMDDEKPVEFTAANFTDLLRKHPAQTQVKLLRPLSEAGIALPMHPLLPPVMAAATTGFGEAAAEHAAQADALIAKLADADAAVAEEATGALVKLYPFAVQHVRAAEAKAENAKTKRRLQVVIAAHPTITQAMPFVEAKKLHEDKAYLLDLLANVPFFRKSARARLAVLYGKDYGDDAANWPKP